MAEHRGTQVVRKEHATFAVSKHELAQLHATAETYLLSLSEYLRMQAFSGMTIEKED